MLQMFEEAFAQVMEELGLEEWYELFDSEDFDLVCERVSAALGYDCYECAEFVEWVEQLAGDL